MLIKTAGLLLLYRWSSILLSRLQPKLYRLQLLRSLAYISILVVGVRCKQSQWYREWMEADLRRTSEGRTTLSNGKRRPRCCSVRPVLRTFKLIPKSCLLIIYWKGKTHQTWPSNLKRGVSVACSKFAQPLQTHAFSRPSCRRKDHQRTVALINFLKLWNRKYLSTSVAVIHIVVDRPGFKLWSPPDGSNDRWRSRNKVSDK